VVRIFPNVKYSKRILLIIALFILNKQKDYATIKDVKLLIRDLAPKVAGKTVTLQQNCIIGPYCLFDRTTIQNGILCCQKAA